MFKQGQKGIIAGLTVIAVVVLWAVFSDFDQFENKKTGDGKDKRETSYRKLKRSSYSSSNADTRVIDAELLHSEESSKPTKVSSYRVQDSTIKPIDDRQLISKANGGEIKPLKPRKKNLRNEYRELRSGIEKEEDSEELPKGVGFSAVVNSDKSVIERVELVRNIAVAKMTEEQVKQAFDFLKGNQVPEGLSASNLYWLKDELYTALRIQETVPAGFVQELISIAQNDEQDPVIRDYALQHLGHYHEDNESGRQGAEQALWEATTVQEGTIAGSALIALQRAQEEGRLENDFNLNQRAKEILTGEYTEESKIVALDYLGDVTDKEVEKIVKTIITNKKTPFALALKANQYTESKK